MAGTPPSKIIETIAEVERIQGQIAALSATIRDLVARVEAVERASAGRPRPGEGA